MRLTRNDRKLRAPIGDISDWPVNADVSDAKDRRLPKKGHNKEKNLSALL